MSEFNIKSWIRGKTLLITGGTGFLGKVLVEKILRECNGVRKIYLLFRARDRSHLVNRFQDYKQNQVFGRLCAADLEKLCPILGDLEKLKLGLSDNDRNLLVSEVEVIMHTGASVKFDEDLHQAVMLNIRGTRELAELAKKMVQLEVFVYVSTAFSNCHVSEINEEIYEARMDPHRVIIICENRAHDEIKGKVARLYPNVYIFSKNLSERLISQYAADIPIAIARPSIITPSASDPYPGWMDSRNGPMGLIMGAAAGVIRCAYGFKWAIADFLPVDKAANGIIAIAAEVGQSRTKSCPVYNLASSNEAPITWHHFIQIEKEIVIQDPYPSMMWYPGGGIHENLFTYYLSFILFQLLPSLAVDTILFILRKRPWLFRLQMKAFRNLQLLSYFISRTWTWKTGNCNALYNRLNFDEKSVFNFKMYNMDYEKYFRNWHAGCKKYYLKVGEHDSRKALLKLRIFYCLELLLKILCFLTVGYVLVKILGQHNLIQIPKLETCGACTNAYMVLKGAYLRK